MTQDNSTLIRSFLRFDSDDQFYIVQVMRRKKDNPDAFKSIHIIKEFYIKSIEQYDRVLPDMIKYAEMFNARVTIRLNRRSFKKTAHKMLKEIADKMESGQYESLKNAFSSSAGKFHDEPNKTWILDFDKEDNEAGILMADILDHINNYCQPDMNGNSKLVAYIPSATGSHLIVTPFNPNGSEKGRKSFRELYPTIEIHKDNPTNIYIP